MSEPKKELVVPDLRFYHENRCQFPLEELTTFAGRYVAWSLDGTRILASGVDEEEVDRELAAAGIEPSQVVVDYVDPPSGGMHG